MSESEDKWEFVRVKWFGGYDFQRERPNDFGFGVTGDGKDVFIHQSAVRAAPQQDDILLARIETDKKGKKAIEARGLGDFDLAEPLVAAAADCRPTMIAPLLRAIIPLDAPAAVGLLKTRDDSALARAELVPRLPVDLLAEAPSLWDAMTCSQVVEALRTPGRFPVEFAPVATARLGEQSRVDLLRWWAAHLSGNPSDAWLSAVSPDALADEVVSEVVGRAAVHDRYLVESVRLAMAPEERQQALRAAAGLTGDVAERWWARLFDAVNSTEARHRAAVAARMPFDALADRDAVSRAATRDLPPVASEILFRLADAAWPEDESLPPRMCTAMCSAIAESRSGAACAPLTPERANELWEAADPTQQIAILAWTVESGREPPTPSTKGATPAALLACLIANARKDARSAFGRFHSDLESAVARRMDSEDPSVTSFAVLLPACTRHTATWPPPYKAPLFCEAKRWGIGQLPETAPDGYGGTVVVKEPPPAGWCPRARKKTGAVRLAITTDADGLGCAPLTPGKQLRFSEWTIAEFMDRLNVSPDTARRGVDAADYALRVGGWLNRVHEIIDRIRCRHCGKVMKSDPNWAKFNAVFRATVFDCGSRGREHDHGVYISHCWCCGQTADEQITFIDSRDNRIAVDSTGAPLRSGENSRGWRLCLACGAGPKDQYASIACVCPSCGHSGTPMGGAGRERTCTSCGHTIRIPNRVNLADVGLDAASPAETRAQWRPTPPPDDDEPVF